MNPRSRKRLLLKPRQTQHVASKTSNNLQSGDQVVDTPYENPGSPRAQGARFRPYRAGFGGFGPVPEAKIQNSEFPMNR